MFARLFFENKSREHKYCLWIMEITCRPSRSCPSRPILAKRIVFHSPHVLLRIISVNFKCVHVPVFQLTCRRSLYQSSSLSRSLHDHESVSCFFSAFVLLYVKTWGEIHHASYQALKCTVLSNLSHRAFLLELSYIEISFLLGLFSKARAYTTVFRFDCGASSCEAASFQITHHSKECMTIFFRPLSCSVFFALKQSSIWISDHSQGCVTLFQESIYILKQRSI